MKLYQPNGIIPDIMPPDPWENEAIEAQIEQQQQPHPHQQHKPRVEIFHSVKDENFVLMEQEQPQFIIKDEQILFESEQQEQDQQESVYSISVRDEGEIEDLGKYKSYGKTFRHGANCFKKLFYWHIFDFMKWANNNIISEGNKIQIENLPLLEHDEKSETTFVQTKVEIKKIEKENRTDLITSRDLLKLVFLRQFKWEFILNCLLLQVDSYCKCILSILMSLLIQAIVKRDLERSYLIGAFISFLQLLALVSKHASVYFAFIFSIKVRMTMMNLMFEKITNLSAFSIKQANIGKILNIISGDINSLEYNFVMAIFGSSIPGSLIFCIAILCSRFGPIGLVAIVLQCLIFPISIIFQKRMLHYLRLGKMQSDQRIKLQNEFIEGIRLIKLYSWEQAFEKIIEGIRKQEFGYYLRMHITTFLDRAIGASSNMWTSFFFFLIVHYGEYQVLSVANIMSTIQLLIFMKQACLMNASFSIQSLININLSFGRMSQILNIRNIEMKVDQQNEQINKNADYHIKLSNFNCYWSEQITEDSKPTLQNIEFEIKPGELIALVGKIGCGKSTLLNCLINEIPQYLGKFYRNQIDGQPLTYAYVEQEPFIFPDSIRRNILFGREYIKSKYLKVLNASQLIDDLKEMEFGDETEIGEKGVNLSGGQKARLSLARALYQLADVYILDDPLSAVDAKVARKIFDESIKQFIFFTQPKMTQKTIKPCVFLATHQINYAIECDRTIILENGMILKQGTKHEIFDELKKINQTLEEGPITTTNQKKKSSPTKQQKKIKQNTKEVQKLYQREEDKMRMKSFTIYLRFFLTWSPKIILLLLLLTDVGTEVLNNLYYRFLSLFDSAGVEGRNQIFKNTAILVSLSGITYLLKYSFIAIGSLSANNNIHKQMVQKLGKTPISYYDTNPSGRIINRFSNDLSQADTIMQNILIDIQELSCYYIFLTVTLIILQPWIALISFVAVFLMIWIFIFSKQIITQGKECDLIQRSPLFDFFKKAIAGVVQIRVYKQQNWFREHFLKLSDNCIKSNLSFYYTQRWFGFFVDFSGTTCSIIGIFIIISISSSDSAIFSQALLSLIIQNELQQWCLRQIIQFDASMNSFNRMFQIVDLKEEAPHILDGDAEIQNWPKDGRIEFQNVKMRYREDMPLILKNMNLKIDAAQKVGCVGRTGAGKSSILQALFRIAEIEDNGQILIDGVNIRELGLKKLRSNLNIIPQIPFVFSGTIRRNIDPLEQYQDTDIWRVLDDTSLKEHVDRLPKKLDTDMSDVNSVFSVGQKQLICLARTILTKKKILVLDEATANIDMNTDEFIQKVIKEKFSDCTIITIAHRLNTIADYDKIMVIDNGQVSEFGSPYDLLTTDGIEINKKSIFAELVLQTGEQNSQAIFQIAKKAQKK